MITKEQALKTFKAKSVDEVYRYNLFTHTLIKNRLTGEAVRATRVGVTRIWENNKNRFEIPIRIGQSGGLVINEKNAHEWSVISN